MHLKRLRRSTRILSRDSYRVSELPSGRRAVGSRNPNRRRHGAFLLRPDGRGACFGVLEPPDLGT